MGFGQRRSQSQRLSASGWCLLHCPLVCIVYAGKPGKRQLLKTYAAMAGEQAALRPVATQNLLRVPANLLVNSSLDATLCAAS